MRTKLMVLAGLVALALVVAAVAPTISTAADPAATPTKGKAAAAPAGDAKAYDPLTNVAAGKPKCSADEAKKIEAAVPTAPIVKPIKPRKLLILTECMGNSFYHNSIACIAYAIKTMGDKTGAYTATYCNDVTVLTPEYLNQFDGIFMDNTTGDHFKTDAARKMFVDYIKAGHGLAGCHAGGDCDHSWPEYQNMIGGEFVAHPWNQVKISVKNEDPTNPIVAMFDGKGFTAFDEIYTFKPLGQRKEGYSRDINHVLLSIDMDKSNLDASKGTRPDKDYGVSWIHEYGQGHCFYTIFGHVNEFAWTPVILKHYLAGIQYALGDLKADATPSAKLTTKPAIVAGPEITAPQVNAPAR